MLSAPRDQRRDEIARTRWIVVERAEDIAGVEFKADLFGELAQSRRDGRFALVDAPARQRPLAAMRTQPRSPSGENQRGLARAVIRLDQRDRDCRVFERVRSFTRRTREAGAARRDYLTCRFIERKAHPGAPRKSIVAVSLSTASGFWCTAP